MLFSDIARVILFILTTRANGSGETVRYDSCKALSVGIIMFCEDKHETINNTQTMASDINDYMGK